FGLVVGREGTVGVDRSALGEEPVLGSDRIGQALFLTDRVEETAAEPGNDIFENNQSIPVITGSSGAGETIDERSLLPGHGFSRLPLFLLQGGGRQRCDLSVMQVFVGQDVC